MKTPGSIWLLFISLVTSASLMADGDEYTIRITRRKHPCIDVPDGDTTSAAALLSWGGSYTFVLRNADLRWIQSASTSHGRLYRRDSILTLSLPDDQKIDVDSVTIAVAFRPGTPVDTSVAWRRVYVRPNARPAVPRPWQRSGLYLRWGSDRLWHSPAWYSVRTLSYWSSISRRDLPGVADQELRYQDYDSQDTALHSFDSLDLTIHHHRHSYRYHIAGSTLPADAAAVFSTARHNDDATLKMYYFDKNAGIVRRKTLYISLRQLIRIGGFFIITKG